MRIGVDLMGSDSSPSFLFQAILQAAEEFPHLDLIVFVTQSALDEILAQYSFDFPRRKGHLEFHIVSEVIEMQDDPLVAFRRKKNSSIVLGIKGLKKRYLDGFVSAGNTGALIAGAAVSLPLLPGIKRPALLANLPTEKGSVVVVDVGGNVSCKAFHLVQFAKLAVSYQQRYAGIEKPLVGLLNIGVESKKGTSEVRQAYQMLQEMRNRDEIAFAGNIEARAIFTGVVDVLVTDGFTGNVLLKSVEGTSSFILQQLNTAFHLTAPDQKQAILRILHQQFDHEEHSGAVICGVDRVIVKCHGQSSSKGIFRGIQKAVNLVTGHISYQK